MRAARSPLLVLIALATVGCALGPGAVPPEAVVRTERAVSALEHEDFEGALTDLVWLASRCEAGEHRLNALLLMAAAELDPMNPAASPHVAAGAAATYLLSADAAPERLPLARSLYRLAADRRGLAPERPGEEGSAQFAHAWPVWLAWLAWPACPGADAPRPVRSLPGVPPTSTAERMSALETSLTSRSDSLTAATARLEALTSRTSALAERASALEAELARIESILRDDVAPLPAGGGH
ncbi:MAG TPA: hypothetical protein VMM35_01960 [Longimicrobiales bacterium]|nr:hypothetical protein [Longimicrobiales bacterium]